MQGVEGGWKSDIRKDEVQCEGVMEEEARGTEGRQRDTEGKIEG